MNSVGNPLEDFKKWYREQDARVRSHIAFFAALCVPGIDATPLRPEQAFQAEKFLNAWLDQLDQNINTKWQLLGRVLYLREIISLMAFRDRATQDDWELHTEKMNQFVRDMRSRGLDEMAEHMKGTFPQMTNIAPIWMKAAESWLQLCNRSLSNEKLETWFWSITI